MKTVGVRELKNRLSDYIRQVRAGDTVLVTDRGHVVAELAPPGHGTADTSVPAGLQALAKRGLVVIGAPVEKAIYRELPRPRGLRRTAAQLLDEERGER
jgi:antitoxin (DNA-binding transcriptional repressor) of toxin-antitoxin stability system